MGKKEQFKKPDRPRGSARLRSLVRRAVTLQGELDEATTDFFAARPFKMLAEPSATEPGRDVYSFRMDRRIPWRIRLRARRLLRLVKRIAAALPDRPSDGALEKIRRFEVPLFRPALVLGARATTELQLDGSALPDAAISAPTWSPSTQEISVVGQDPDAGLRGKMDVRFQLELNCQEAPRQSVVALTGAAIWEAEQLLLRANA